MHCNLEVPPPSAHSFEGKNRESSIELLRIISMLMVMLLHVNFRALNPPSIGSLEHSFAFSVVRTVVESFTFICVDVFVLISGWFGIKAKWSRLLELVFQVMFFCLIVDIYLYFNDQIVTFSFKDVIDLILLNDGGYWFVRSYIVLYIFVPMLNAYLNTTNKVKLRWTLILIFFVQTVQGFVTDNPWYSYGYSPLTFMFLYLLARYMRLYPSKQTTYKISTDFCIYIVTSLLTAIAALVFVVVGLNAYSVLNYLSPLVILAAVYFFLAFTKFHFTNKSVNYVAISSFAAYLLHGQENFLDCIYCAHVQMWITHCSKVMFVINSAIMIFGLFALAIILDKLRIRLWDGLVSLFTNRTFKTH